LNCVICRPLAWLRKRLPRLCIADRAEVQEKFAAWRYAQANDRKILESDSERDAVEATMKLRRSDPEAAFPQFLALAERGSVWSMLCVGWMYMVGVGVAADATLAEHWYRLAFEGGSQRAQLDLGKFYRSRADFDAYEKIFEVGIADNWAPPMYYRAMLKLAQPKTRERLEEARVLLEAASALGDIGAQWALGRMMTRGRFGWRRIRRGLRLSMDACKKTFVLMGVDTPTAARPSPIVGATDG
jgi:TPR repeat protein